MGRCMEILYLILYKYGVIMERLHLLPFITVGHQVKSPLRSFTGEVGNLSP
jgi:hypothetical protein